MSLIDLPPHVLVQITSHLDFTSLKHLALVHPILGLSAETWLYRHLSFPLHNPHRPVTCTWEPTSWECDYNLSTQWEPIKPSLAIALAEQGWKEDSHQSNHLDASLRLISRSMMSRRERADYVRELHLDLKKRYHDTELDMNGATLTSTTSSTYSGTESGPGGGGYRGGMWFDGKEWGWEWDDPTSSARAMLHLAQLRKDENPDRCPLLRETFTNFPVMRGVKNLVLDVYESWQGYLDHVLALVPNLEHLIIRPNALLVDSPLDYPRREFNNLSTGLKSIKFESMLDCFQPLVVDMLDQCPKIEHVVLADRERGSRRQWTLSPALARSLASSSNLRKLEMGRTARDALRDMGHECTKGVLVAS